MYRNHTSFGSCPFLPPIYNTCQKIFLVVRKKQMRGITVLNRGRLSFVSRSASICSFSNEGSISRRVSGRNASAIPLPAYRKPISMPVCGYGYHEVSSAFLPSFISLIFSITIGKASPTIFSIEPGGFSESIFNLQVRVCP